MTYLSQNSGKIVQAQCGFYYNLICLEFHDQKRMKKLLTDHLKNDTTKNCKGDLNEIKNISDCIMKIVYKMIELLWALLYDPL